MSLKKINHVDHQISQFDWGKRLYMKGNWNYKAGVYANFKNLRV